MPNHASTGIVRQRLPFFICGVILPWKRYNGAWQRFEWTWAIGCWFWTKSVAEAPAIRPTPRCHQCDRPAFLTAGQMWRCDHCGIQWLQGYAGEALKVRAQP